HLLAQRARLDAEQLGDLHAGEGRRARAQEERARLAIEDDVAERRGRQPRARAKLAHRLVEARTPQRGIHHVELRKLQLGDQWHLQGVFQLVSPAGSSLLRSLVEGAAPTPRREAPWLTRACRQWTRRF